MYSQESGGKYYNFKIFLAKKWKKCSILTQIAPNWVEKIDHNFGLVIRNFGVCNFHALHLKRMKRM
jgi:hypothetical protein